MTVELRPHQEQALKFLDNGKVLNGGVGSGKSITSIEYYMRKERGKDIYVITTVKKRDTLEWEAEAVKFGISTQRDATRKGCGTIHVDSWNNIGKYVDVEDAFFIFDEQRVVGNGTWAKAFQKIVKRNRWIMLTATPGDVWMDYAQLFIANQLYKNITEFRKRHCVFSYNARYPKIERYIHTDELEKYRQWILVDMPYEKHTNRTMEFIDVDYDKELYNTVVKDRWNPYLDQPQEDVAEMFRLMRRVAYSDESRMEAIHTLLKKHQRVVIFYNFNYELEMLRTLEATHGEYALAEWNGHKHQPVPETEKWIYLVQYNAGSEGWNCITTDTIIYFSLTYSYKAFEQSQGRIDRLDTPFEQLNYYVLFSQAPIDSIVWKALKGKQNFNELAYLRREGIE